MDMSIPYILRVEEEFHTKGIVQIYDRVHGLR